MSVSVGVSLVGSVNDVAGDEGDFGRVGVVEISLFAGASDVVCTVDHGLHPAKSAIARGADVRGVKGHAGECYK